MARGFNPAAWYRPLGPDQSVASQGDQLFGIRLQTIIPAADRPGSYDIGEYVADVIIATQSCDLDQRKVAEVEVVPVYALIEWLHEQPLFLNQLEAIRRGHVPGLYLLPAWPDAPFPEARTTRIIAFDEKRSITWAQLEAAQRGRRLGLCSPYIEHFGQALARFYMRVGLPEDLPELSWKLVDGESNRRGEQITLTSEHFAAFDLPSPTQTVRATIQRLQTANGSDVVYRASLERDGNFYGVGDSSDTAVSSLLQFLVTKRAELRQRREGETQKLHWLLQLLPEGER